MGYRTPNIDRIGVEGATFTGLPSRVWTAGLETRPAHLAEMAHFGPMPYVDALH